MNLLETHGEFPTVIYKVFNKLKYAEDFLNGIIRFSKLSYYQSIEDKKRRDDSEGDAYVLYDEIRQYHSRFASNSFYIFCTHNTLESSKLGKFGKYIVEINNPKDLSIKISNYLSSLPAKHFGGIEGINIKYSYGEKFDNKPTSEEMARLSYSQKPLTFKDEYEFRFVFIKEQSFEEHAFIILEHKIENARILT